MQYKCTGMKRCFVLVIKYFCLMQIKGSIGKIPTSALDNNNESARLME